MSASHHGSKKLEQFKLCNYQQNVRFSLLIRQIFSFFTDHIVELLKILQIYVHIARRCIGVTVKYKVTVKSLA